MRESHIEKKVVNYAVDNGWLQFKFVSVNCRGVPDRIFIRHGVVIFIEFKAPNKKLQPLQKLIFKKISDQNIKIYVVDNIELGKRILDEN